MSGSLLERYGDDLPGWMVVRSHWVALMGGLAALLDGVVEIANQARTASLPGQLDEPGVEGTGGFDSVDALPYICRDRLVVRGLAETVDSIAWRCRRYADDWARGATAPELLEQLAAVLGPNPPMLRLVSAGGTWWTRTTDGRYTLQQHSGRGFTYDPKTGLLAPNTDIAHAFDWDSATLPAPPDQNDPCRFFIVVYAPCNLPYLADTDGVYGDSGTVGDLATSPATAPPGSPDAGTVGTVSPIQHVETVRALVARWRAIGFPCSHIIVTFDPASFDPVGDSTPTSIPDGTWGYDHNPSTGMPTRFVNARYWPAAAGGIH